VLGALSVVAYLFFARSAHDVLEPLLALPEGQAAYAATMRRVAETIALFDLPLIAIVGVAAYVLARVSVGPLVSARQREERFAADAAHELRTPLATIAAVAQAARSAETTAQREALVKITAIALEASTLLGDLMALMRDAPDAPRLHEPVDVGALANAVVHDDRPNESPLSVVVSAPPDGAYVIGDERALRQLVRNLLANALRHDGPGVAPADRERIFDRFFKADADSPGSGLGLAICRHIATQHGGTIALESGSRFVARFPRAAQ
jgi:two-component system OmpR family sensor kinase